MTDSNLVTPAFGLDSCFFLLAEAEVINKEWQSQWNCINLNMLLSLASVKKNIFCSNSV